MADEEETVSDRLSEIERKLNSLADDVEEAVEAATTTQEVVVRLERLIDYEIIHPLQRPSTLDSLGEVRDKLDEMRDKLDELLKRIG